MNAAKAMTGATEGGAGLPGGDAVARHHGAGAAVCGTGAVKAMSFTPEILAPGVRAGRWTLVSSTKLGSRVAWDCICDCGTRRAVRQHLLSSGGSKSCGCLRDDVRPKNSYRHGQTGSPMYRIWGGMIARCRHESEYRDRGIVVCERWKSFTNFLADMGERPPGMSLGRIDNDGNYEPGNCRWETVEQQQNNTRRSRFVTAFGKTQTIKQWSRETGLPSGTILSRIDRYGWPVERAVSERPYEFLR